MRVTTRCKAYRLGRLDRVRNYKCRVCGDKFQRSLVNPLPPKERVCRICQEAGHEAA